MKLRRIAAIPFALVADVVTLGNMGDRSFTQQVFDAERREQQNRDAVEVLKAIAAAASTTADRSRGDSQP